MAVTRFRQHPPMTPMFREQVISKKDKAELVELMLRILDAVKNAPPGIVLTFEVWNPADKLRERSSFS